MTDTKPTWEEVQRLISRCHSALEQEEMEQSRDDMLNFIRANFISRSQVAEVIEELRIVNETDDQEYGYNVALTDLKSTLLDSEKKG